MKTFKEMMLSFFNMSTSVTDPIDKDFDTVCCGREMCNIPPKTVLAAFFSIIGIIVSVVFLVVGIGPQTVFISLISSLVTLWVPSPIHSSTARKDVVQNASLLQAMHGDRLYSVRNGRFTLRNPHGATV